MTPRSLWTILIKVFGLFILSDMLSTIPYMSNTAWTFSQNPMGGDSSFFAWLFGAIVFYVVTIWLLLFKTDLVIDKLSLDKHFKEEKLDVNLKASTVLQIAIVLFGCMLVLEGFPAFAQNAFQFYQQKAIFRQSPNSEWLIYHGLEMVIGYFIITNSSRLTSWVDEKRNK